MALGTPTSIFPLAYVSGHVTSGASVAQATTVDAPVGSMVCAFLGPWNNNAVISTFRDSSVNSWNLYQIPATAGNEGCCMAWVQVVNDMPIGTTFSSTQSDAGGYFFAGAFKVSVTPSLVPVLDTTNQIITSSAGTSFSLSTGVLATYPELIIGFASSVSGSFGSWNEGAGFSTYDNDSIGSHFNFAISYQAVTTTPSVTWNPNWLNSETYGVLLTSFYSQPPCPLPQTALVSV